ncbi:MoaD/ThiS family protein [Tindallia californiensis]|uniref:Sulfur carrier protein ThiS (Thiamine biosynthesis) n=1 Tax=Tindallia californiensis TaxID=159292 RepID=A0A1H3J304_9FIRM|nr:MoaD/ThiS family protein [Tindallia californiensis]SDY33564.1 Sulfur carrier protein ThiS (thiamine biosynthesis) [Tindallia californiensis]
MINVTVTWISSNKKDQQVTLSDSATVQELLDLLCLNQHDYLIIVKGSNRLANYPLSDKDIVKILYSMAGG